LKEYRSEYRNNAKGDRAVESLATVERAMDLLFHLNGAPEASGVTAIGRALGLPKSSVHRMLTALARRGLVERDAQGRYRSGIGLVALGLGALEREPAVLAARPVLESEAAALGETFFLVGARAGALVVLDKAEGTGFLRAAPRVGASVPVHATAVGKLFLAFGADLVAAPAEPFERFTARTARDAAALRREVQRVRERGYAENREEWIEGLGVVAAPIFARGRLAAALVVAAPAVRVAELGAGVLARRAVAAAARVGARLEGRST
jgi:DNA-binding IclR family transcriptional regulator